MKALFQARRNVWVGSFTVRCIFVGIYSSQLGTRGKLAHLVQNFVLTESSCDCPRVSVGCNTFGCAAT